MPGDKILFRAGEAWWGGFAPKGSGRGGAPIVIGRYGEGALPVIDGKGSVEAAITLFNQEYWTISDLEITNKSSGSKDRIGVLVAAEDYGTVDGIALRNLYVHDVGYSDTKEFGGIITRITGEVKRTRFNDLLVEGCRIKDIDRTGICMYSSWKKRKEGKWHPSTNVVFRRNVIERIGRNGLIARVCDGALIERNVFKECGLRGSGNALFPFNCDNTIIQYNESCFTKYNPGDKDAAGFDSDWKCNNTVIQYNYSHDNDYGFVLVCCKGGGGGFNRGVTVRYNISQNDNDFIFRMSGPVRDVKIYNNAVYIGKGTRTVNPDRHEGGRFLIAYHKSWGGWPDGVYYFNNIFYNLNKNAGYRLGKSKNVVFQNNLFFGYRPVDEPLDSRKVKGDPKFLSPGSGKMGWNTLEGYRLKADSPAIDAGRPIRDNGGRDFFGSPLKDGRPDIGVCEFGQ